MKSETMKLLGSNEKTVEKDNNFKNVPQSEITVVVLVHCNAVNNSYQHESLIHSLSHWIHSY